ncbi:hypothetical protein PFISCL1PPCAC_23305, partial [Pristionchus fissidentatus]
PDSVPICRLHMQGAVIVDEGRRKQTERPQRAARPVQHTVGGRAQTRGIVVKDSEGGLDDVHRYSIHSCRREPLRQRSMRAQQHAQHDHDRAPFGDRPKDGRRQTPARPPFRLAVDFPVLARHLNTLAGRANFSARAKFRGRS